MKSASCTTASTKKGKTRRPTRRFLCSQVAGRTVHEITRSTCRRAALPPAPDPEHFPFDFCCGLEGPRFHSGGRSIFCHRQTYLRYLHALLRHVSPRRRMHEQSVKAAAGSDSFAGEWREARHVVARRPRKRRSRQERLRRRCRGMRLSRQRPRPRSSMPWCRGSPRLRYDDRCARISAPSSCRGLINPVLG